MVAANVAVRATVRAADRRGDGPSVGGERDDMRRMQPRRDEEPNLVAGATLDDFAQMFEHDIGVGPDERQRVAELEADTADLHVGAAKVSDVHTSEATGTGSHVHAFTAHPTSVAQQQIDSRASTNPDVGFTTA